MGLTQPPYGQQPGGPYRPDQQQPNQPPPYQQPGYQQPGYPPGQPPYQYGPPSMASQQGQGLGWGPQFAPPPGPPGYPPPPGGFPPGPGFQPGWQPQLPRRKKSKAPLFAVLGVVLVGVVGLWIFGVIKKNADNHYTQPAYNQPSHRSTEAPFPTSSTEPTGQPTATRPTQPRTTQPTQTATSKPPAPTLSSQDIVAKNRLYKTGQMRSVNCKEPNVKPNTAANAAKYWAGIKPCLDRSWARQVALAGYKFKAPTMLYWSGTSVNSPCGNGPVQVPFFCSTNHMMYMKVDNFVKSYNEYPYADAKAYARMWYSRSIAHEYGHAMQSVTGILEASYDIQYELTNYDDRMRQTRRLELQANCFAGVFLAANKRSYPVNGLMLQVWNKWVVTSGDKPEQGDHGSPASQAHFMGRAFLTGNPASCNTFAASKRYVS